MITSNGTLRMNLGKAHEENVQSELQARGWHVQPWGQGLLDSKVRTALVARAPIVLWRWIPDLIAVNGNRIVLIDPKSDASKTANFALEISAVQAHRAMSPLGLRIVYVFADMSCNFPEDLVPVAWFSPEPGRGERIASGGSGTPFMLIRKTDQRPMDDLFGKRCFDWPEE